MSKFVRLDDPVAIFVKSGTRDTAVFPLKVVATRTATMAMTAIRATLLMLLLACC